MSKTVLVVDDSKSVRAVIGTTLKMENRPSKCLKMRVRKK
jgi:CheY-like chemotaxis protein